MNIADAVISERARRKAVERQTMIDARVRAGTASAAARLLKYGREGLIAHLRRIAPSGGTARVATMSPEHKHKLAVAGGKAGWKKLSLFQAVAKRMYGAGTAKRTITHEQRVANGRLGAARRWGHETPV